MVLLHDLISSPDILPFIACHVYPIHMHALQMTCVQLNKNMKNISSDVQKKCRENAIIKYAHAVLLPSGAFQLNTYLGFQTLCIRALPGMNPLMFEANLMNAMGLNPVVSVMLNGTTFIGRPWGGRGRDFMNTYLTGVMFDPKAGVLSSGDVWISSLDHKVDFFGKGLLFTELELTLDRGYVAANAGKFLQRIILTPVESSVGKVVEADLVPHNRSKPRAHLTTNGAFRFYNLEHRLTADIRLITGFDNLMVEAKSVANSMHSPVLSMLHDGELYVGRPWGCDGRTFLAQPEAPGMFHSDSKVLLQLAGGAWIRELKHEVDHFRNGTLHTVLDLTLHTGDVISHGGGVFNVKLIFTKIGW